MSSVESLENLNLEKLSKSFFAGNKIKVIAMSTSQHRGEKPSDGSLVVDYLLFYQPYSDEVVLFSSSYPNESASIATNSFNDFKSIIESIAKTKNLDYQFEKIENDPELLRSCEEMIDFVNVISTTAYLLSFSAKYSKSQLQGS